MNSYTDVELEELAKLFFQGFQGRCPRCSTPVEYHDIPSLGRSTTDVIIMCPRCNATGQYSPLYLEAMQLKWSDAEKKQIIDEYWGTGRVLCPKDGSILQVNEIRSIGSTYIPILVNCRLCGRMFESTEIEMKVDPDSFDGKYEIIRGIAKGGMGSVSLARRRTDGQLVAAKKILPQFLKRDVVVRRFQREARILTKVAHHNVVSLHEFFIDETGGIIVMELMTRGSLRAMINDSGVDLSDLVKIYSDISAGLQHIHEQGIIHRDLKPDNVLIDSNMVGKISDLGLAMMLDRDSTTLTNHGLGTPRYMAPEQTVNAAKVDEKSDIYAMGLICYEIISRQSPFHHIKLKTDHQIYDLIENATLQNPDSRTVTLSELDTALQDYLQNHK